MSDEPSSGLSSLANLRVVELGVWVAAPSAAALLADWGADVIKVEAPAGDPMRQVFGSLGIDSDMPNPAFSLDNRGKRSVVLDLRRAEGREHLEDLLATADVFISNLRPDALDRLGLEPAATVERHPHLVYCSISGYGLRGAERNRPTYDIGASGPGPGSPCRWPTTRARRSTRGAASVTTSPGWPPWAGSSPPCWSSARRATGTSWRCRCSARAPTSSGGTSDCR